MTVHKGPGQARVGTTPPPATQHDIPTAPPRGQTQADWLMRALADPRTYSQTIRRLGAEIARCHICVAGSASEGDTQDVIDTHRTHREALKRTEDAS